MLEHCHITDYSAYRRISRAIICLGIASIAMLQGCQSNAKHDGQQTAAVSGSALSSHASTPRLGERFALGSVEVTVNAVEDSRLASGEDYLVIRWSYMNASALPMDAKPSIHLVAPSGDRYSADIGATFSLAAVTYHNEMILGEMSPGVKNEDADVFEVGQLGFDPATWRIVIEMGGREMPLSFASSLRQSAAIRSSSKAPTRS